MSSIGIAAIPRPTFTTVASIHLDQKRPGCCIGGVDHVGTASGVDQLPRPLEDYDLIYIAVPGGRLIEEEGQTIDPSWRQLYPWLGDQAENLRDWLDLGGKRLVLMGDWFAWTYEGRVINEILGLLGSSLRVENAYNGPTPEGADYPVENTCFYDHDHWPNYGGTADTSEAEVLCENAAPTHPLMTGLDGLWAHIGVPVHGGTPLATEPEGSVYSGGTTPCTEGCDCEGKAVAAVEEVGGTANNPSSIVVVGDMHVIADPYPYGFDNTATRNEDFIRRLWPGGCNLVGSPCRECNLPPSVKVTIGGVGQTDPPSCEGVCDGFNGLHEVARGNSPTDPCVYRSVIYTDPDHPSFACRVASVSVRLSVGEFFGPGGPEAGVFPFAWRVSLSNGNGGEALFQYVSDTIPCHGTFVCDGVAGNSANNLLCDYDGATCVLEVARAI